MKTINMLGVDYTEEKIQVLSNYLNHMNSQMGPLSRMDSLIEYMIKSQQVSDAYMAEQSEEDKELLMHFAEARDKFSRECPGFKLALNSILVVSYGMVSSVVPPLLNLGICAIFAKMVTNNIIQMSDKNAFLKIRDIIMEKYNKED